MAHLISVSNLKKLSYISSNVDDNLISTIITRVQDTVIEPILGSSLYNHLLQAVDNNTLNINEQELLSKYLSNCLIAAVEVRAVDTGLFTSEVLSTFPRPISFLSAKILIIFIDLKL